MASDRVIYQARDTDPISTPQKKVTAPKADDSKKKASLLPKKQKQVVSKTSLLPTQSPERNTNLFIGFVGGLFLFAFIVLYVWMRISLQEYL